MQRDVYKSLPDWIQSVDLQLGILRYALNLKRMAFRALLSSQGCVLKITSVTRKEIRLMYCAQ
jgi:hypothetical protein